MMPNLHLEDFKFARMWPRSLFKKKEGGRLLMRWEVPDLQRPGVYVLYKGEEPHYVGRANRLYYRLHDHANKVTDPQFAHWDYFSAFALSDDVKDPKAKIMELEAVLIAAIPRAVNHSTPRFPPLRIPKVLLRE
jgi:hypothetical protein